MKDVKIERKELSNGLQAILVTLGEQEGIMLPELARLLGVERQTLSKHCKEYSLSLTTIGRQTAYSLRKQGVIALTGRAPNFLPRETVEALVKIVNTPEAWAIYKQLWSVARSVYSGDIVQATVDVGLGHKTALEYLRIAVGELEQTIKERDAERTAKEAALKEVKHKEHYAVTNLTSHGVSSFQLVKAYPSECYTVIDRYRATEPKAEGLSDTGALTMALRESGIVSYTRIRTRKGWTTMFDKDTVEAYIKGVK